ncbi:hypothetical protein OZD61_02460 [Wolbachia endosymbiont of Drosophila bocki]|uniref:hypothetical protein n=1 Tax=Wolbachia endosymbiont of Drosophila bocki TaxID=3002576 RepID=UPI0023AA1213|nr:hypothetical protein [Wolbachia endosymbiont of Drosophila bocki]MDE5057652.1 hypothetical protein [Wolbachia endosymbiont of Drosophila bocki]
MLTFKSHCGQPHKANTVFVAFTAIYVMGGLAILSTPLWRPSTCKLAAFAATPLGMGVLAFVAAALTYLAIYAISKNNEISELKALKAIKDGLLVTKDAFREIARNNQVKDEEGKVEKDKCYIDFSLEGKNYRIIVDIDQLTKTLGNTLLFKIDSLKEKNDEGKFEAVNETKWSKTLGLDKDGAKEVNTYLGSVIAKQVAQEKRLDS